MGFYQNTCKPEGLGGKLMTQLMNGGHHAKLAEWGFSFLTVPANANILDAGCGGGANLARWLAQCPNGQVTGLDYSPVSVATAKKYNRQAIADGRCQVVQGNVAVLPFEDNTFDVVSAFETVYFWPELPQCFCEVGRVLKSGGTFLICNESNGDTDKDEKWTKIIGGMTIYKDTELKAYLEQAGFHDVQIHKKKSWLCITARK